MVDRGELSEADAIAGALALHRIQVESLIDTLAVLLPQVQVRAAYDECFRRRMDRTRASHPEAMELVDATIVCSALTPAETNGGKNS